MLFVLQNCSTHVQPKRYPAPRGETDQPQIQSGSDHIRSHIEPVLGISCFRSIAFISSILVVVGDNPPCTQKILSSITAAKGRQSNISVQYFQTLSEPYFLKHSSQKPQTCVICLDQWFPRNKVILDQYLTLSASSKMKVQTLQRPRSTKSPIKRQVIQGASPPILKSQRRSQNCPCISPHTVTGESIRVRLGSLISISFALSHSSLTLTSSIKQFVLILVSISYTTFKSFFIEYQTNYKIITQLRPVNYKIWITDFVLGQRQKSIIVSFFIINQQALLMGKKTNKQTSKLQLEVFVSGIPYTCQEEDLHSITSIKLPKYQDTGRCLGYAHVVFDNQQQYEKALSKNRTNLGSRYLEIQPAKGQKEIQSGPVSVPVGCKVLFIKNLPYNIQEEDIRTQFSSCGIITDVRMVYNSATQNFKGFAYVDFRDLGSVKKAISKYQGKKFQGRVLALDAVTTQQKKGFKKRNLNRDQEEQVAQ